MSAFRDFLQNNPEFHLTDGVFCQRNFSGGAFEEAYVQLREREGRLYDDDTVRSLPEIYSSHPLQKEWSVRRSSANRLVTLLQKEHCKTVLELGCGNGWLTNYIAKRLNAETCGIDVEMMELRQAVRLSANGSVFVCADIFSDALTGLKADAVVVASCFQYFPNPALLINRLKTFLTTDGCIHIIDSPFYNSVDALPARERSERYFESQNASSMSRFYFHHGIESIAEFNPEILHNPKTLFGKFQTKFLGASPFPWFRIRVR